MATEIVGKIESARLKKITGFEEMLTDTYLSNLNNKQTRFIYDKFFKGSASLRKQRLSLLNISYSLPLLISEKIADYVGTPQTEVGVDLHDYIMSYAWGGYAVFKCEKRDGKFVITQHNTDGYVKNDDGSEDLLTYLLSENANGVIEKYILKQTYYKGTVTNNLYKMANATDSTTTTSVISEDNQFDGSIKGSPVLLNSLDATAHLSESEVLDGSFNPIVVVNNTKISSKVYGESEISKVKSLISSIEIQLVNLQDQLLKHLQAKLAIPTSKLPIDSNGMVNMANLEVIGMEAGDPMPQYIINENKQIEKSFVLIEHMIRQIAVVLSMPVDFFGLKNEGGVESKEAKMIKLSPFIKKIERVRKHFTTGLQQLVKISKSWGVTTSDVIVWSGVFPTDKAVEANELSIALDSQLISRKKAIMKYQDITEDEANIEMALINNDNATINDEDLPI